MLTAFGKFLRKLRIDLYCNMKEMSDNLNVTVSFLSAVETGKRNIPKHWRNLIVTIYDLDARLQAELDESIDKSLAEIKLNLDNLSEKQKDLALIFSRKLDMLDDDNINEILINLNKEKNKKET